MELAARCSILLVEDNPGDIRLIQTFLESERFQLKIATSLRDAIDALQENLLDAILLDLRLPDTQGLETLDAILNHSKHVPIVVLTGLQDDELALEAIKRGAQDYLTKGQFDEVLLARVIRYAIERSLAEASLRGSEARYRTLFEQANEAVLVLENGKIVAANPETERMSGWSRNELLGIPLLEIVDSDSRHEVERWLRQQSSGESEDEICEFPVATRGERTCWVEISATEIEWQDEPAELCLLYDITGRRRAEELASRSLARQTAINELTLSLGATAQEDVVYERLCDHVSRLLDSDAMLICRFDPAKRQIRTVYVTVAGVSVDVTEIPPIPIAEDGRGLQSSVLLSGEPLLIEDYEMCQDAFPAVHAIHTDGSVSDVSGENAGRAASMQSAILAPMRTDGDTMGVFQVQSSSVGAFTQADVDLLQGLTNVAAIALRNIQLVQESLSQAQRLRLAFDGIVKTISAAVETRDPYTAGHQRRVSELAAAIAGQMGLDVRVVEGVRVASLVHDIGKLGVPAEILAKPGALSDVEFEMIKEHSTTAYHILQSTEFPWPIAEFVYQHHERLDGSGYPRGLVGDDIFLEARIIGVADIVEAMASHRPYRAALGIDAALSEIETHRECKLDASVVDACIELFREKHYQLPV